MQWPGPLVHVSPHLQKEILLFMANKGNGKELCYTNSYLVFPLPKVCVWGWGDPFPQGNSRRPYPALISLGPGWLEALGYEVISPGGRQTQVRCNFRSQNFLNDSPATAYSNTETTALVNPKMEKITQLPASVISSNKRLGSHGTSLFC